MQTQQQYQNQINGSKGSNGVAISTTNKLVYIARIEAKYGERDIIEIINNARVGRVQYADMTAVKDNSPDAGPNPAFKFYSAFVMMSEWNPNALADLKTQGQIKLWTDPTHTVFWVLRFATDGSEIPRSKVNTHQLAHYTAELYDRMKTAEKKVEEQAKIIEDNDMRLNQTCHNVVCQLDRMEILEKNAKEQAKIIEDQNTRMAHMLEAMEKLLEKNEEMTNTIAKTTMIVSYMDSFMTSKFAKKDDDDTVSDTV
jgi:hypothetical protein